MTEIIYQSDRTMVVEIAGLVHFVSTFSGKNPRPYHSIVRINGSCCIMDGPLSLPDAVEAMRAVTVWAIRRDRKPNPSDQRADAQGDSK